MKSARQMTDEKNVARNRWYTKLRSRYCPSGDVTAKKRPNDHLAQWPSAEWPETFKNLAQTSFQNLCKNDQ